MYRQRPGTRSRPDIRLTVDVQRCVDSAASVKFRDIHVSEIYPEDPPGGFSDSLRTVILGVARLGSGFFGRAAV